MAPTIKTTYSRKRTFASAFEIEHPSHLPSPPPSSSPRALQPLSENVVRKSHSLTSLISPSKHAPSYAPPKASTRPPFKRIRKFTQLTIDLGGNPEKRCKVCGMEYIPSNAEDAKLHKDFHNSSVGGIDIPSGLKEKWRVVRRCDRRDSRIHASKRTAKGERKGEGMDNVIEVGRMDPSSVRNLARKALDVVERDLGAVKTDNEELWGPPDKRNTGNANKNTRNASSTELTATRSRRLHKIYLYVQNAKCVGLCLAVQIHSARKVLPQTRSASSLSSSLSTSDDAFPAVLGISRIWVSKEFRGKGVAQVLLDTARSEFSYGITLEKESVAFSQPTESGLKLANSWFGNDSGWLVYDEKCTRTMDGQLRKELVQETGEC